VANRNSPEGLGYVSKTMDGGIRLNAKSNSRCAVRGHLVDPMVSGYLLMAQVTPPLRVTRFAPPPSLCGLGNLHRQAIMTPDPTYEHT
jgi:hypothetical protein